MMRKHLDKINAEAGAAARITHQRGYLRVTPAPGATLAELGAAIRRVEARWPSLAAACFDLVERDVDIDGLHRSLDIAGQSFEGLATVPHMPGTFAVFFAPNTDDADRATISALAESLPPAPKQPTLEDRLAALESRP